MLGRESPQGQEMLHVILVVTIAYWERGNNQRYFPLLAVEFSRVDFFTAGRCVLFVRGSNQNKRILRELMKIDLVDSNIAWKERHLSTCLKRNISSLTSFF